MKRPDFHLILKCLPGLFGFLLSGCASWLRGPAVSYSDSLFVTMTFIEHTGEGPMQNYLAQNVHYPPVEKIREQLEARVGVPLKNRGEAHITVVTPVEYDKALAEKLPIAKINEIARGELVQAAPFEPVCVGRGHLHIDGNEENTFFVVVKAPKLIELRQKIHEAFVAAGGDGRKFDPNAFYPHVTVGFTKRDLHFEEGVVKDDRSCAFRLEKEAR